MPEGELAKVAFKHLKTSGLPQSRDALRLLFAAASKVPSNHVGLVAIMSPAAPALLEAATTAEAQRLFADALAHWWLLDATGALKFAKSTCFGQLRSAKQKASFVEFGRSLVTNRWGTSLLSSAQVDACLSLVPSAVKAAPVTATALAQPRFLASQSDGDLGAALISHIAAGPDLVKTRDAFRGFLADSKLKPVWDWLRTELSDIERRIVDDIRLPTVPEVIDVLFEDASLVRSSEDLFLLCKTVFEEIVQDKLFEDHSLVPDHLWIGTKKAGRKPVEEKKLQPYLSKEFVESLKGLKVVGSKEPEVIDAKKPDLRVQAVIDASHEKVNLPIEMKGSYHADLWTAAHSQLARKYMKTHSAGFGLYVVGWFGEDHVKVNHPTRIARPKTPQEMRDWLQEDIDKRLEGTQKRVGVVVLDVSIDK